MPSSWSSIAAFASEALRNSADILLPIGPFTETSGTFVNAEGRWQSFAGVASPVGDSRPGWKVLRVLGNQFGLDGFEQTGSEAGPGRTAYRAGRDDFRQPPGGGTGRDRDTGRAAWNASVTWRSMPSTRWCGVPARCSVRRIRSSAGKARMNAAQAEGPRASVARNR